jgi:hypothetical protein
VFRRSFGILVREFPVVVLVSVPVLAPLFWFLATEMDRRPPPTGFIVPAFVCFAVICTHTCLTAILAPLARGLSPATVFPRSPKLLTVALVLGAVHAVATLLGPKLWVFAWILLTWYFFLVGPVAAMERVGLAAVFARCMTVTFPGRKKVAVLIGALMLVTVAALNVPLYIGEWTGWVLMPLTMVFAAILAGVTYDELRRYSSSPEPSSSSSA